MTSERTCRIAFWLLAALGAGCADFSRGPAPGGIDGGAGEGGANSDGGALSFAADIESILVGGCQRCHSPGGEASDTNLLLTGDPTADLATVSAFVDVNTPASSRLLAKMTGNGHGGGTVFATTSPEYQTVLRWIQEGARP